MGVEERECREGEEKIPVVETEKNSGRPEFFSSVITKKNNEIRVASIGWRTKNVVSL